MREVPNLQIRINWTKYAQLQYVLGQNMLNYNTFFYHVTLRLRVK